MSDPRATRLGLGDRKPPAPTRAVAPSPARAVSPPAPPVVANDGPTPPPPQATESTQARKELAAQKAESIPAPPVAKKPESVSPPPQPKRVQIAHNESGRPPADETWDLPPPAPGTPAADAAPEPTLREQRPLELTPAIRDELRVIARAIVVEAMDPLKEQIKELEVLLEAETAARVEAMAKAAATPRAPLAEAPIVLLPIAAAASPPVTAPVTAPVSPASPPNAVRAPMMARTELTPSPPLAAPVAPLVAKAASPFARVALDAAPATKMSPAGEQASPKPPPVVVSTPAPAAPRALAPRQPERRTYDLSSLDAGDPSFALEIPSAFDGTRRRRRMAIFVTFVIAILVGGLVFAMIQSRM